MKEMKTENKRNHYESPSLEVRQVRRRNIICSSIAEIEQKGSDLGDGGEEAW